MALSLLAAAPGVYQCDTITPSTATLFTYEDKGTYKKVTSTQCSQTYILYPRGETAPDLSSESADYLYFGVPLQNVAVTQTVSPWGAQHPKLAQNTTEAAWLLDEAGWPLVNGVRTKSGVALSLDIVYYTFRSDLVAMAPYVVSQLTALGIQATSRVNDNGDYMDSTCANTCGDFDMLMWAQHTLPAGDPNWYLETFFKTSAIQYGAWSAQNFAMYSSTTIDAALATLSQAAVADRLTASAAAVNAILDEVPATFLTSPVWHVGLGERMTAYEPWGSDYYVVKSSMPATDWPPAVVSQRVYTLDGTMDANGPPYGGTDWYESRVAEPDAFVSDMIAVLHNSATSGLNYLRHAATGTTNVVTASQCVDASAARAIRASTCAELDTADPTEVLTIIGGTVVVNVTSTTVVNVTSTTESSTSSDTGLYVAIDVLACVAVLALLGAVGAFLMMKKVPAKPATAAKVTSATADSSNA